MKTSICALLLSIAFSTANAETISYTSQPDAGPLKGKVQVEYRKDVGAAGPAGKILVTDVATKRVVQALDTSLASPDLGQLEFEDLNGDQYQDLMFINNRSSDGDTLLSDVFLWSPSDMKFLKSPELSQAGGIARSARKGCVTISTSCDSGYRDREMCFRKGTGKWNLTEDSGCTPLLP